MTAADFRGLQKLKHGTGKHFRAGLSDMEAEIAARKVSNSRSVKLQSAGMAAERYYPRFAEPLLKEALADTPVVLIHGPRQCGKTTLAQHLGAKAGYAPKTVPDPQAILKAASRTS